MVLAAKRKKSGKYTPGTQTSSKRKNQSMTRTRHRREKAQLKEAKNEQRADR